MGISKATFNTHRTSKQKINKEVEDRNSTVIQMSQTYIYRTFHLTAAEYTLFSSTLKNILQDREHVRSQNEF